MGTAPRIAPRSIVQFFRAAAWVVLAASLGACSGQPSGAGAQPVTDTDGGVTDVAADGGLPDSVDCPGPASIGAMDLVAAWQAHQPTTAELNETAFMWALAIQTVANGGLDPETQAVVEAALADPTQANLFGAQVPGLYPALFNGCDLADDAGPSDHRHIVHTMHYPFQCSDDCRASLDQLLQYYGIYGNVLQALGQKLGADVGNILGNVISATGNGGRSRQRSTPTRARTPRTTSSPRSGAPSRTPRRSAGPSPRSQAPRSRRPPSRRWPPSSTCPSLRRRPWPWRT